MPWLTPYTIDAIKQLAERGVRKITVASPSFAVDCLETLEEVAMEYRDKFTQWGGEQLTLVPCLNDDDAHARALANIVTSASCARGLSGARFGSNAFFRQHIGHFPGLFTAPGLARAAAAPLGAQTLRAIGRR